MLAFLFFISILKVFGKKDCNESCHFTTTFDSSTILNPLQFIKNELELALQSSLKEALQSAPMIPADLHSKLIQFASESLFPFAPPNSKAQISDWAELYFYFPHLKKDIAVWRAQFIATVQGDDKTFKGCANPAVLAKALVPTFDELSERKKRGISGKEMK